MLQFVDGGLQGQVYVKAIDFLFCLPAPGCIKGQQLFEDKLVAVGVKGHLNGFLLLMEESGQVADRSRQAEIRMAELKSHEIELHQSVLLGCVQVEVFIDIRVGGYRES